MKRWLYLLAVAAVGLAAGACSDDKENPIPEKKQFPPFDFTCYSVYFMVEDAATGANLLDPMVEGNLLDRVKVIYKGKEYTRFENEGLDLFDDEVRASYPRPFGVRWGKYGETTYCISFGEFTPAKDYQDEPFTVEWGDGSKTEAVLDCFAGWNDDGPQVTRYLVVDGTPAADQQGWVVRLTR